MLLCELRDESFDKTAHRQALAAKLNNRSNGSIEYKHQNISAVLIELGAPSITGYKPRNRYQKLLRDVIIDRLDDFSHTLAGAMEDAVPSELGAVDIVSWNDVLESPPEREAHTQNENKANRVFEARGKYTVNIDEQANRKLGLLGEQFVLQMEKQRMEAAGRIDLAKEVEWTSEEKGDGTGYDIRSFNPARDEELFIEVKTTVCGKRMPFYISANEVAFSKQFSEQYALYRVFEFRKSPKLFLLHGDVSNQVNLEAQNYRASYL